MVTHLRFNSTLVRLGPKRDEGLSLLYESFNSTLVRLGRALTN